MKNSALNARLLCAAELTRQDATFADIGTDHAYLPLFLLDSGKIKFAYCCDINVGPLASARKNAEERARLDKTEFILTDGATVLSGKGITDYAICGMGGELIADIIERAPHLKDGSLNLILQPMTKQEKLREYLAEAGFKILCESYVLDAGKYYVCLSAVYDGKSREISALEAIAGSPDSMFLGAEYRRKYLDNKLSSLIRAAEGKRAAGIDFAEDEKLISSLQQLLLKGI